MNKAKEDLLLHPVRMRIMQAVGLRQVTAQQLARELADVPQATLYRHINTLAGAGILTVVGERRVHNTLEKTYALAGGGQFLTPEDVKNAQPDDYIRVFTRYLGQLLGYFTRYVEDGDVDVVRDWVGFRMVPVYLSEVEMQQFAQALNAAVVPYLNNEPAPQRRRFILGTMMLPDVAGASLPFSPAAGRAAESSDASKEQEKKRNRA